MTTRERALQASIDRMAARGQVKIPQPGQPATTGDAGSPPAAPEKVLGTLGDALLGRVAERAREGQEQEAAQREQSAPAVANETPPPAPRADDATITEIEDELKHRVAQLRRAGDPAKARDIAAVVEHLAGALERLKR